jgi:hypothetical protein
MADSTTTGSAVYGTIAGGLVKGMSQVGGNTPKTMTDKILYVYGAPTNVVTASVGSQLAFDVENNDIYCALTQNGSSWNRLGSMT